MRSWACALLAVSLLVSRGAAADFNPLQPPAPEFPDGDAWINAKPLTIARLKKHRVTLLAFLDTANLNSLRALKVLNLWQQTYATSGVMIIGALTPIYSFQRDPIVLRADAKRLGIDFPLIIDNDRRLWKAYANEGWPAFYLIDRKGRIVYSLLGEQRYTE
ncbi:MAG: thioredoxin, partial [Elusimicrobia bacterium]|nr:thioredoxin [Elusimicrobiota bacterium]